MTTTNIVTGHEVEIAELEAMRQSASFRANCIAGAKANLEEATATLVAAASGTLQPAPSIFGKDLTVAEQVSMARQQIATALDILARYGA